jgi:hypothetical protein
MIGSPDLPTVSLCRYFGPGSLFSFVPLNLARVLIQSDFFRAPTAARYLNWLPQVVERHRETVIWMPGTALQRY